jgi:serine/threonine-protein kinase HipA
MSTPIRLLRLYLHVPSGERKAIGYLSSIGDFYRVSFDAEYVEDSRRPTLSIAYRSATEEETRQLLAASSDERLVRNDGHWPAWFANLLPEGPNRERLARARVCSPDDEFELLAAAGRDHTGAVEVAPVPRDEKLPATIVAWHAALGISVDEREIVAEPTKDAFSLSGVVTKFSAIHDGRRYIVRRKGEAGEYIIKLPSRRHPDLVDNELTGYRLAGILDLDCAEAERVPRGEAELPEVSEFPNVLVVKRFDRGPNGKRVHMEEMAQAMGYPPRKKYGKGIGLDFPAMLVVLDRLSADPSNDVAEAVRRLVAFILMGNADAHLKNWALIYRDGVTPALSPLYDPVCVTAFFDELEPHEYTLNRNVDHVLSTLEWDDLRALIARAGVPRTSHLMRLARETVKMAKAKWPAVLRDAPANLRQSIEKRLAGGVALAR